jgi:DNA-binding Lrp family transcriptional regulator
LGVEPDCPGRGFGGDDDRGANPIVTAIVLLNVARTQVNAVAETLAEMAGTSEVYSVTGEFDLVAIVRMATNEDLAALVTERLVAVAGIEETTTMLALKVYSRHDLKSMFFL